MRNKTAKVQTTVTGSGILESLLDDGVLAKLVLLDGLVNANDILPYNTAGANVQVTDFRVSHESLRQANCQRRGVQLSVSSLALVQLVHDRGLGVGDGIAVLGALFAGHTPTVNDDYSNVTKS